MHTLSLNQEEVDRLERIEKEEKKQDNEESDIEDEKILYQPPTYKKFVLQK